MQQTLGMFAACALAALAALGGDVHHSKFFSEIGFSQLTEANKATFAADARKAGIDQIELAVIDFYETGSVREAKLKKLKEAIAYFEGQGFGVTVWFDTLGYGNRKAASIASRLKNMTRLTAFGGKTTDALCPADPAVQELIRELVRDIAKAGAKALLIDDDFIQSVRPGIGCVCPHHLARVAKRVGRPVTEREVKAAFTGEPNALRTAFLDVGGEVAMETARELRATVDAVNPNAVLGIAASYTHYDVEGVDITQFVQTLAGPGKRGFFRISGAPYWSVSDRCYKGAGLESVYNFVRLQSAWLRESNMTLFDENDPYPRKVAVCPAWKTELYDKVMLADGALARHKYILCYGADRKEPGYLDAHVANMPDDPKLARMFAGKVDAGLKVFYPQHSLRDATLPTPYMGDQALMTRYSHPVGADALTREGFATRFAGEGPAFVFGTAATKLDLGQLNAGVIADATAARILAARGVKLDAPKIATLDFDLGDVVFDPYEPGRHRAAILAAYRKVAGDDPEIRFEIPIGHEYAMRFYPLVKRDSKTGRCAVLIENLEDKPISVRFVTARVPAIAETLRGDFRIVGDQLWVKDLAPHAYAAVTFDLTDRVARPHDLDITRLRGYELWGRRKAHPAVVNSVIGQDPANVISLRGAWEFQTVRDLPRNNRWDRRHLLTQKAPWGKTIHVPACWEAQGVGEPQTSACWDIKGDENSKPIRHAYWGTALYRKRVTIPAAWRGKRIWLKVGGAKSVGWFYIGDQAVGCVDTYCATYKYDVTDLVTPGEEAVVAAGVRNDVPSRKGLLSAMNRWGGLYRDVELEATPETLIDDAWVRGDFDARRAEVHVTLDVPEGAVARNLAIRATIDGQTLTKAFDNSEIRKFDYSLTLPLPNFRPWSPEAPNLYTARVDLVANGTVVQTRFERFGVRKLEVRGKQFYLNNRPFFFRGFGDDHVYPLTGITPPDVNVHRRHLATAHRAGFNYVRLHTHVELPEYFEAADENGILIEAELPYYNDMPTEGQVFDPVRDVTELYETYRRHPSFAIYSMGNEGSFSVELDRALHAYVKKMDPDRLKINQDCHVPGINPPESADFVGGPISNWPRGSFNPGRPFVTHEYLNLGAKQDSRLEARYTGVWQVPVTRAARAGWLGKFGLDLAWGDRLQNAQHTLQRVWQKRGVECARTDPYCDGFCDWTIVDVVVANLGTFSAQGLFNPFWEQKEGSFSADEFRVFNRPVGLFCDFRPDCRAFAAGEKVRIDFILANFGERHLADGAVDWSIAAGGETLARGSVPCKGAFTLGTTRPIAAAEIAAPAPAKAVKATLRCAYGRVTDNSYDIWLFPARAPRPEPNLALAGCFEAALKGRYTQTLPAARAAEAEVVVAPYGSPLAAEALARGQSVVTLAQWKGEPNVRLGWWWMGSQVGTAFRDSPAFKYLPHEGVLNELFFRTVKRGRKLPYAGLKTGDLLAVGEGGSDCYLYLAQVRVGKGRALMAFGLDVFADTPEAAALLDGLIDYVRSGACAPESVIEMASMPEMDGYAKTVKAGDRAAWPGPFGEMKLAVARGTEGLNELEWRTRPVPADVRAKRTHTVRFFGGQGYVAEPPVSFTLFVNGKAAVEIPEVTLSDKTWTGNGCTLAYKRDATTEEYGVYTLTVPTAALAPGQPIELKVVAKPNRSRRWFAICENFSD